MSRPPVAMIGVASSQRIRRSSSDSSAQPGRMGPRRRRPVGLSKASQPARNLSAILTQGAPSVRVRRSRPVTAAGRPRQAFVAAASTPYLKLLFLCAADRDAWLDRFRARCVSTLHPVAPTGLVSVWAPEREPEPGEPAMLYASEGAVRAAERVGLYATAIGLVALPARAKLWVGEGPHGDAADRSLGAE